MLLFLMTTLALAEDTTTKPLEIDFEEVELTGKLEGPTLELVTVTNRPKFQPGELIQEFVIRPQAERMTSISLEKSLVDLDDEEEE